MKQKYFQVKGRYKDYIVFVKSGNFWNAFYGDALIIHFLTGYNFTNYHVILDKVINMVSNLNINFISI